jgi:NADH dehydrogenase
LPSPQVVIVGGGFGGLNAAKALLGSPVQITLVDRRNFHLFQPLLYQVATGGLTPADIAAPLRAIFGREKNVRVLQAEVRDLDVERRELALDGEPLAYDYLILATGATHHYFGHEDWARWAPGLKTIEDATSIRARILDAFERAERERDPAKREALLTFVIVGGGPTGVELAGAIGELARETLAFDFRAIDPRTSRILLLEAADRLLLSYPMELSARAAKALSDLGVTVWTNVKVTSIEPGGVENRSRRKLRRAEGRDDSLGGGGESIASGRKLAARSQARGSRRKDPGRVRPLASRPPRSSSSETWHRSIRTASPFPESLPLPSSRVVTSRARSRPVSRVSPRRRFAISTEGASR